MAIFHGTIRSSELDMETGLTVILPQDRPYKRADTAGKVLYLLHGLGGDHTVWTRYTNVERYARDYGLIIVMPEVQRSFYYDMYMGMRYFSYIAVELPELCKNLFGASRKREDNYIAGLSMGGYGAMKCGFRLPEQYAGIASFSGLCNISRLLNEETYRNDRLPELRSLFGVDLMVKEQDDLFLLADRLKGKPILPQVFITCGKQDFLYEENLIMIDHLKKLHFPFEFQDWDGDHEWGFWDISIQKALQAFFD